MSTYIEILILSAIQGITEFLPVSSAAHLIIASKYFIYISLFNEFINQGLLIDICLHIGSLLAIIFYFRKDLFNFIQNKSFLIRILIGTIPVIPVGFILYHTGAIEHLRNAEVIGWTSLTFGILLHISDKKSVKKRIQTGFTNKSAIVIGLFQVLSLIPGVSRSGITITSGRLLGFNRFDSAKISFFLSIPTLTAVSLFGIYNIYQEGDAELNLLALISIVFSFLFSYFTIKIFLNYIKKFSLKVFVIYRIFLSLIILLIVYL